MNLLLPPTVAALALACAFNLQAEVRKSAEGGQNPTKLPASLDKATQAKALLEEAASLVTKGRPEEALAKARESVAIDAQSPIRFPLEMYDAHPETAPALFAAIQDQVKMDRLIAADQTNQLQTITLPDLAPAERTRLFKSAVSNVLEEHGFIVPVFVERAGSLWTAVSSRPRLKRLGQSGAASSIEVLQAVIETTPDNQVTLELLAYAWIGSDYAGLGIIPYINLGITQERAEMGRQLQAALAVKTTR